MLVKQKKLIVVKVKGPLNDKDEIGTHVAERMLMS